MESGSPSQIETQSAWDVTQDQGSFTISGIELCPVSVVAKASDKPMSGAEASAAIVSVDCANGATVAGGFLDFFPGRLDVSQLEVTIPDGGFIAGGGLDLQ